MLNMLMCLKVRADMAVTGRRCVVDLVADMESRVITDSSNRNSLKSRTVKLLTGVHR